ncbi:TonB-dependent receptor [Parvularcula lutaonensis]|uniref:TonB-dependent receptor n=1 Tax=Parvularcula lutaonensis TaxID=491923 RepID=A0ABV7MBQ7_9PROT
MSDLMRGGSIVALAAAAVMTGAHAQADSDDVDDEDVIVVRGIKKSLRDAQDLKEDADVFLDAISAADISALPDRSVSEALQRVPGVSVLRFAGPNDPDHFGVEGSGVIVRGLPFVRAELNGRDVFSASQGGGLNFEDVSPELLGSVIVFKNQSADMIEGGLSGTVDLRTRLPFDQDGRVIAGSFDYTYSDFAEKGTPSYSVLLSDRWQTDAGSFGLLVNFADNELKSRADATAVAGFRPYTDNGDGTFTRFAFDQNGFPAGTSPDTTVYIPDGGGIRTQNFDRGRTAFAAAGQWESNDETLLATAQFLKSSSDLTWGERVLESTIDNAPDVRLSGPDFSFDEDGVLTNGTVTETVGWRGNDGLPLNGVQQSVNTRERVEDEEIQDLSFNLKWTPNDRWAFNFDAQFIEAETEVFDVSTFFAFFADLTFDLDGDYAEVSYAPPTGTPPDYFADFGNYYFRGKMDHFQDNDAEEQAFRADAEYDFHDAGWLQSARFGARYADQDSTVRYTAFNWGNVSEIWTGTDVGTGENILRIDDPRLDGLIGFEPFSGFYRDDYDPMIAGVPYWSGPLARDYDGFVNAIQPILDSAGSFGNVLPARPGVDADGFLPSEISEVSVETWAFYGRLDFGGELSNGMTIDGNVGLRYVSDEIGSNGSFTVQPLDQLFGGETPSQLCAPGRVFPGGPPGICSQDVAAVEAFLANPGTDDSGFENEVENWLPSFNLKLNLTPEMLLRFGYSRALTRPSDQQLRTDRNIFLFPDIPGVSGNEFGGIGFSSTTGGNPFLDPVTADSFDISYEWYFADNGSFSFALFHKSLEGYWVTSTVEEDFTRNGVTLPVTIQQTVNSEDDVNLSGFEIGYQQFYEFLPAPFDGLGTQFNYTYIDANGVADIDNTVTATFPRDGELLERVSEHQFNIAGLYQKDRIEARLAYNWRDDFLLTRRDVIFPFASIYQEATGQLDGSIFYNVTDDVRLGVQAVNILDDITETTASISPDGLRGARNYFRNDRRVSFVLRANF